MCNLTSAVWSLPTYLVACRYACSVSALPAEALTLALELPVVAALFELQFGVKSSGYHPSELQVGVKSSGYHHDPSDIP